jgi:hypothetical protein
LVDLNEGHIVDRGGEDLLSQSEISLIETVSAIDVQLEQMRAKMSEGESVDLDLYGRLAGHSRRIHETLDSKRRASRQ